MSQPVPTTGGWAVLKITDERPYVSTKKDPKQQKDDVEAYKSQVAQAISTGFYATLKRQAKIDANLKASAEATARAAQEAAAKATAEGGESKSARKKREKKEAEMAAKKK